MLPVKKILAPTDFSEPSRRGVQLAVELAGRLQAELIPVHATPPLQAVSGASTVCGYYPPNLSEAIKAEAGEVGDRLRAEEIPSQVPSRLHILDARRTGCSEREVQA